MRRNNNIFKVAPEFYGNNMSDYALEIRRKLPDINIDILKTFGPSMVNADRNGDAKTIDIGGDRRLRASSASLERVIKENLFSKDVIQTRHIPQVVSEYARKVLLNPEDDYIKLIEDIATLLFKNKQKSADGCEITKQGLTINLFDIEEIIDSITEYFPVNTYPSEEVSDKVVKPIKDALIKNATFRRLDTRTALFGRMSTDKVLSTVDSATVRSHLYSVNSMPGDLDTYSQVDEFLNGGGSAHLDDMDLNSSCFYTHRGISMGILFENLCRGRDLKTKDDVHAIVETCICCVTEYIKEFIMAVPAAKKSSAYTKPIPHVVYITVGDCQGITMDAAFEKAVRATGTESVADVAVKLMKEEIENECERFGVSDYEKAFWIAHRGVEGPKGAVEIAIPAALKEIEEYIHGLY